jgi:hypothetical protein
MNNSSNQMTRWTSPTNPAFYALHKNAIGIFQMVGIIVQLIWLFFSTRPLAEMLVDSLPSLPFNYALAASFVCLAFLHYVIHELVRYIFFNIMDDDPNTNNSIGSMGGFIAIVGAMLLLDIQGVTSFIRDEKKYDTLHTQNETQGSQSAQKRIDNFNSDLATINAAFNTDFEAIRAQYALKLAKASRVKTFDEFDVKRKKATIANIKAECENAISIKKTELATAQRKLVEAKNADLAGIDKKHNELTGKIENANAENQAKANSYGWIVSIFCLITLLFCTYQSTDLRVKSGQKPVSRYTIADATGSTTTKLFDVITDAWQRQSHRFLVFFHGILTTGTQELDELDGAFNLKKKNTAPIATTPPAKGGGTEGGDGGSDSPKPIVPPAPAQPLGGKSVHAPYMTNPNAQYRDTFYNAMPETLQNTIAADLAKMILNKLDYEKSKEALIDLNPEFSIMVIDSAISGYRFDESLNGKITSILKAYNKTATTPALELVDIAAKSVITDITPVITAEETKAEIDNKKLLTAFKAGIQDLNSECRNYETKNGSIETIANRIAEKIINLYNFSQEQSHIIPSNVYQNFEKSYRRGMAILEDFKSKEA